MAGFGWVVNVNIWLPLNHVTQGILHRDIDGIYIGYGACQRYSCSLHLPGLFIANRRECH